MIIIREATIEDAQAIADIYNYYLLNTTIVFQEEPFSVEYFEGKINGSSKKYPFIVIEEAGQLLGYALLKRYYCGCSYGETVELSIYILPDRRGSGLGNMLITELLNRAKANKLHTILAGIVTENEASIALHEKFGFEKVGHLKQMATKFGRWLDVGYWQLIID